MMADYYGASHQIEIEIDPQRAEISTNELVKIDSEEIKGKIRLRVLQGLRKALTLVYNE